MNPAFRFQGVLWFAKRLLRWHPLTKCEIVRWNLGGVKKQKREPAIKDSFFYLFLLLFLPSFIWGEPEKQGENWTGSDYRATVQRPSVIPLISEEKSTRLESVEGVGSLCVEIPWFPTGFGSHPWWWMQDFDKCRVYYTDWCWGWILYLGYPPVKRWRCIWVNRGIYHSEVLEHSYEICTWEGPKTSLERISSLQKVPKEGRKENYTPLGQSSLLQKAMDSYFENPIPLRPGPFGYLPISCEDSRADTINKNLPKSQRSNGKNLESLPSLKPPENGWLEYDCFLWD